jgi:hypothetical protein
MGREVRKVPADWQHPRGQGGEYIPLHEGSRYRSLAAEWDRGLDKWNEGLIDDLVGGWEPIAKNTHAAACASFTEWHGKRPTAEDYMPDFPPEQRTHYQMYETTSEGTPISPVFATPEELARWLADTGASASGSSTATYDQWLETIRRGSAVTMVIDDGCLMSGVEAGI